MYHVAKLRAYHETNPGDMDYTKMYNRTLPLYTDANTKYSVLANAQATQTGQREYVTERLAGIKGAEGLAHNWYDRTKVQYFLTDKPRFTAIWNHGLAPFDGTIDGIVAALNTLSMNIGGDTNAEMILIKEEVDAEYLLINPGRTDQQTDMETTNIRNTELDSACVALMKMEYRNSGLMMDKFEDNPDDIQESIHDMELLIGKQQSVWDIHPTGNETVDIAKRAQLFDSKFKAKVVGGGGKMFLATTPGGTDSTAVDLVDGVERKFLASAFGVTDYVAHRYITFVNLADVTISFKLKLG